LNALWAEGLLAQTALLGRTKGWRNHPQLLRFKIHEQPVSAIGSYLLEMHHETDRRGYSYDKAKILVPAKDLERIDLTKGQLSYEFGMLKDRLRRRASRKHREFLKQGRTKRSPRPNFVFHVVEGEVEDWERSYWRRRERPNTSPDG
jgi:hypothetical protein